MRAIAALLLLAALDCFAAPCKHEDFDVHVSARSECLLMRRYGAADPATMIVWIHGNVSAGGPANSHFRLAEQAAAEFAAERVLAVALVRPGYPDGTGESSSGSDEKRGDNWKRATVLEVAVAIERLRDHFKPKRIVLIGHSGGAAIAGVILGMRPHLADAALLIACPCDVATWRPRWTSESPLQWAGKVEASAHVLAITGSRDVTVAPEFARTYVEALKRRGVDAGFELVPDVDHVGILHSNAISRSTATLLASLGREAKDSR